MRVVTTSSKAGFEQYGQRWLDSRVNWPADTEFIYYVEGFSVPCESKDFRDMPEFHEWKMKHVRYQAPGWKWQVVRYAHKVFAAIDALYDYEGVGVWLDADCVTYKPIPDGLIEKQVENAFIAHYGRTGFYTETGLWIMDCNDAQKPFFDYWRNIYVSERYKKFPEWTDCATLDAAIKATQVPTNNLSGEHHMAQHPQALTELGQYIDHTKGQRKKTGISPENKFREAA